MRENGELLIAEDEAEVIRIIYDKFVNTTMGAPAIATYLNEHVCRNCRRSDNCIVH